MPEEKTSSSKDRTNDKLHLQEASPPGFEPRPHWWEESSLNTAHPSSLKAVNDTTLYSVVL